MDETISKVIAGIKQSDGIDALWLYGSRARQDHTCNSDHDFAIKFSHFISDSIGARLRPETLSLDWSEKYGADISVIDIDRVSTPLAMSVVEEGVLLLDKTSKETAFLYQKIWSKWDDWQYHRSANSWT